MNGKITDSGSVCCPFFVCVRRMLADYENLFVEGKAISELFINEQIRDKEVRVIGEEGEQLGIMSVREALKLAEEAGVDLVKIAPTAKPPVCKIVDQKREGSKEEAESGRDQGDQTFSEH